MADIEEPYKTLLAALAAAASGGGIYKVWIDYQNNRQTAKQKQQEGWSTEGKQIFDLLSADAKLLREEIAANRKEIHESDKRTDELREQIMGIKETHRQELESLRRTHQAELDRRDAELRKRDTELLGIKNLLKRILTILQRKENIPSDLMTEIQAITET